MAAPQDDRQHLAAGSNESDTAYVEPLPTSPLDISALIAAQRLSDGEIASGG